MIYLYWYLGIGVAVSVLLLCWNHLTKKDDSKSIPDLLATTNPNNKKTIYQFFGKVINFMIVAIVSGLLWPLITYMAIYNSVIKKTESASNPCNKFAVEQAHLLEHLSMQDIENREFVFDPLGAVPNLPFGHLNAAWKKFIENLAGNDEIWSFSAQSENYGQKEFIEGYVLTKNGNPWPYFVTASKYLPQMSQK